LSKIGRFDGRELFDGFMVLNVCKEKQKERFLNQKDEEQYDRTKTALDTTLLGLKSEIEREN
jgi:hypothetical protein